MVDGKPWSVDSELAELDEFKAVTPLDQLEVEQANRQEDMDLQQTNRQEDAAQAAAQQAQAQQAQQAQAQQLVAPKPSANGKP